MTTTAREASRVRGIRPGKEDLGAAACLEAGSRLGEPGAALDRLHHDTSKGERPTYCCSLNWTPDSIMITESFLPDSMATVVDVKWSGTVAVELRSKDALSRLGSELLYRIENRPWSFDNAGGNLKCLHSSAWEPIIP